MKELLTGNEAFARGVIDAGVHFASAYPGTPSSEILKNIALDDRLVAEWAPNEKVAMESAIGASIAGGRAFASMKHVGLNVAADPFMTYAYMGVHGGFVFVSADDPGQHSSQNEQDNRNFAKFGKVAMLEPSDSQECYDMVREAYELSEELNTIVMVRSTTRISHAKSLVEIRERKEVPIQPLWDRATNMQHFGSAPSSSKPNRRLLDARQSKMRAAAEASPFNTVEDNGADIGIVTSGAAYNYVKEVFGDQANILKLGFTCPLPLDKIREFAGTVKKLYVVEELDPFMEEQIKAAGIDCIGKEVIPAVDELNPGIIAKALLGEDHKGIQIDPKDLIPRPPTMCAGCPHRSFFYALGKRKNCYISNDIGCYTLGGYEPLFCLDSGICMGSATAVGHGVAKILQQSGEEKRVVAVMGDSTFFATGMNGLENSLYNGSNLITVVLDNRITAMTGHQENPGSGFTAQGEISHMVSVEEVARAFGCNLIRTVNPHDQKATNDALDWAFAQTEPCVIISRYPCALKKYTEADLEEFGPLNRRFTVDQDVCIGCKKCTRTGCPAIIFQTEIKKSSIDRNQCLGCSLCSQVCPVKAIHAVGEPCLGKETQKK